MIRTRTTLAILATGTLLAACGSNDERTATTSNYILNDAAPYATLTLTPEQQQRRDALNMQAYESEYRGYADNGSSMTPVASPSPGATETVRAEDMNAGGTDTATNNTSGAMGNSTSSNGMSGSGMSGSGMSGNGMTGSDFASLDRNGDGKLSVAEYAVYAVNLDPNSQSGKPNDQKKPYATADQLNRAADGFFHYDANGDTYLQPDEFRAAQAGSAR